MDGQFERLSKMLALPQESIDNILLICFNILVQLRPIFPRCMVVPFGSTVTGLGMLDSDGDLAFLSDPPKSLVTLLTNDRYFSEDSLATIKKLEETHQVQFAPPPHLKSANPSREELKRSFHETFSKVLKVMRSMSTLRNIQPIKSARCPIIKFVHKNPFMDCDISIEEK